jgi:hypothetical protein
VLGSVSIFSEYRRGVELVCWAKVVGAIEDGTAIDAKVCKQQGTVWNIEYTFLKLSASLIPSSSQRVVALSTQAPWH